MIQGIQRHRSGIRARCNAILQYSTAPANREGTCAEDGMRLLYDPNLVKPEMCSLDCSLIGTSWGDRTFVYEWYRPFLLKYARKMRDMGIKPELECFNPESVEDVFNVLVPAGVLEEPVSLSFVMGMDRISQGSISFSEENLDFMIKKLPKDRFVNFSTISIGAKHHVPGMAMTVLKGGGAGWVWKTTSTTPPESCSRATPKWWSGPYASSASWAWRSPPPTRPAKF